MPRLLPKVPRAWQRGALHLLLTSVVAGAVAFAVLPLHNLAADKVLPADRFVATSVLLSWALVFPALAIQRLRMKAQQTERLAQLERQAHLEAQLQALQARTNPHFFFNSINTVSSLIPDNPALAERTLERLADLFRYALDASKTRVVPLSREVEMVRDYLEIQRARFGDRLSCTVELDPAAAAVEVPPLLLQPLVENAILHGLAERKQGTVAVEIRRLGAQVILEVRDDGPGPGASLHRGTQTAVKDLRERLRLLYGEASSFSLDPAPGGGCLARMAIPLVPA
jgi:two-component system sensor histidine kinase AlgZ